MSMLENNNIKKFELSLENEDMKNKLKKEKEENKEKMVNESTNQNYFLNPYNNLSSLTGYNYGMFPYNSFFGLTNNSYFNKVFQTFERINFQIIQLCEIIRMIQMQLPTFKLLISMIKKVYIFFTKKYKLYLRAIKSCINYFNSLFKYDTSTLSKEEMKIHIEKLKKLLKVTFLSSICGIIIFKLC